MSIGDSNNLRLPTITPQGDLTVTRTCNLNLDIAFQYAFFKHSALVYNASIL